MTFCQRWNLPKGLITLSPTGDFWHSVGRGKGSGTGRDVAVNYSPTRLYQPVVLFHHKEPQRAYLTPISLIRSAATNKNKRQKGGCERTKMTKQSKAPSICRPFITFPCKMTDKSPKTMKEGKTDDKLEKRERIKLKR